LPLIISVGRLQWGKSVELAAVTHRKNLVV
jgi:hypothetical protein